MPVEFLTDDEAAGFGRYAGVPSRADLERVFFLDDEDRVLIERRRGAHLKLGFALQLVTVRWVGAFLEDPLDVPQVVLDFMGVSVRSVSPAATFGSGQSPRGPTSLALLVNRVCPTGQSSAP